MGVGGAMAASFRCLRGDQRRSGREAVPPEGWGCAGREGVTWMCGRRSPQAPLERVELLAGAMGDGGGFQCHGNAQDGSGSRFVVESGFSGIKHCH